MATTKAKTTAKKTTAKKGSSKSKVAKSPHTPLCISGTSAEITKLKNKAAKAKMPVSRYVFEVLLK